jgi:hypothetical protein
LAGVRRASPEVFGGCGHGLIIGCGIYRATHIHIIAPIWVRMIYYMMIYYIKASVSMRVFMNDGMDKL